MLRQEGFKMSLYPVLVFDWNELPGVADNIWQAQKAGWEQILTYRGPLPTADGRRIRGHTITYEVDGQRYRVPTLPESGRVGGRDINSRDEYPFACTEEGAAEDGSSKPWVGHVPPHENCVQGAMIAAFILKHGLEKDGVDRKFEVRVINHPEA